MDNKDQNEKKPFLSEGEIKRQIGLQNQADSQRKADEQKLLDEQLKEQIEKEKKLLPNFFIKQADARSPQKKKKKNAEDEVLKKYLTSIGVTGKQQDEIIAQIRQPYTPHFQYSKDYYKEIFRLNAWDDDYKSYYKPREVAVWTVRLIYGRFMKERPTIMDELREKNKYIGYCVRRHKFFQYLTPEAQDQLDKFIDDCIDMMKQYADWQTFEAAYCTAYGLPYQQHLFSF
jgi:hypothetical protein